METDAGAANLDQVQDLPEGEGGVKSKKQNFVTGALLNRCPDPLKADLDLAVLLLKNRTAATEVVNCAVFKGIDGKDVFDERFVMKCSAVDRLVDSLRESNELSPRLDGLIARLRLQFGALIHYFSSIDSLHRDKVDNGIEIMREMSGCSKYPERIFQNITLMRLLMKKASNFDEAQRVYQYLVGNKYTDAASGLEKLVCKPDTGFFKLWFDVCTEPRHFQLLHEAVRVNRCNQFLGLFLEWKRCCRSFSDFEKFFDCGLNDKIFQFDNRFFMFWLRSVQSLDQLLIVIESLFKVNIVPDQILINTIFKVALDYCTNKDATDDFMLKLNDLYTDGRNNALVFSKEFRQLWVRLKGLFKPG